MAKVTIAEAKEARELVKRAALKIAKGEMTVEALLSIVNEEVEPKADPKPPAVPPITEVQRAAITRLPKVYGRVVPVQRRALSEHELELIAEERDTIDTVLKLLEKRKTESIRETLSTHFDVQAEADKTLAEKDSKGHYTVHQEQSVPKVGKKFVRQVTEPKPKVSAAKLLELFEDGELTRAEYLSLTSEPEIKRDFDPEKAVKAITRNPSLIFILANATEQAPPSTSIYFKDE